MFTLIIEDMHGGIADEYTFEEGEFLIGRSQSADIILPSDNVSRRHSRLYTVDGKCYIEDLNSSNGVFVNGRRIHEVYEIQRSAQIKVGDYYLHIESSDAAAEQEEVVYARLHGQNLGFAGQVFPISRTVTLIGRGKDCSLTLIDPSISRIHTKMTIDRSGTITVEDLKSSNGTFVNDERVEIATLNHSDVFRMGNAEFIVEVPAQSGAGAAPAMGGGGGLADFEDAWQPQKSRTGLWITLSILATIIILGGVLMVIFGDQWFGGDTPPTLDGSSASSVEDEEKKRAEEIDGLKKDGAKLVTDRDWEKALEVWQKILDLDPLDSDARKAINQITTWQKDKQAIDEANKLMGDKKFGAAAKAVRDIAADSAYFAEAREVTDALKKVKPTLVQQADALIEAKDCEGAKKLYREAIQLDPKDALVIEKLKAVQKLPKAKCTK